MTTTKKVVTKGLLLLFGATVIAFAVTTDKDVNAKAVSVRGHQSVTGESHRHAQELRSISVDGKQIMLSKVYANQIDRLKRSGVTVFFPKYTPQRFCLASVSLVDAADPNPDYRIEFRDKNKMSFAIESAYTGIGDGPDGDKSLSGISEVFGPFTISVFKPGSEGNCSKNIYYLSSWMPDKKRMASEKRGEDPPKGRHYHFLGDGISDKEAVDIVKSLMPVD